MARRVLKLAMMVNMVTWIDDGWVSALFCGIDGDDTGGRLWEELCKTLALSTD